MLIQNLEKSYWLTVDRCHKLCSKKSGTFTRKYRRAYQLSRSQSKRLLQATMAVHLARATREAL